MIFGMCKLERCTKVPLLQTRTALCPDLYHRLCTGVDGLRSGKVQNYCSSGTNNSSKKICINLAESTSLFFAHLQILRQYARHDTFYCRSLLAMHVTTVRVCERVIANRQEA